MSGPGRSAAVPLFSIVMPVRNGAAFIEEAVRSVLDQDTGDWELLIVDNGSTDGTPDILSRLGDPRIVLLHEPRPGVAHARNLALAHMRGSFFCFLDADDRCPPDALTARYALLKDRPAVHFADGAMQVVEQGTGMVLSEKRTTYRGHPFDALMRLDDSAFLGNTWLIRRAPGYPYAFPTHMRNSEDLAFYLSIAAQGEYDRTDKVVLLYRKGHGSATSHLADMHHGYRQLHRFMRDRTPATPHQLRSAWARMRGWMFKDLLRAGHPLKAVQALFERPPNSLS